MRPAYVDRETQEPRRTRRSGVIRVAPGTREARDRDRTGGVGAKISRPNSPLPDVPSIVVDASYLEAPAPEIVKPKPTTPYRVLKAVVAVSAFLCGALIEPSLENLTSFRSSEAPVMLPAIVVQAPSSATQSLAFQASPPATDRLDQQEAERLVRLAHKLRRTGREQHAQRLLAGLLEERPGHPQALAAMAWLEMERGDSLEAVRWARHGVQSLPGSADHWMLLSQALARADLHEESRLAARRAAELSR
jgi:hypothetical protein